MTAREADEDILKAGLARGQVQQFGALSTNRVEQSGDGLVRFPNIETNQILVVTHGIDARRSVPGLKRTCTGGAGFKLDYVMTAEAIDEIGGRAFGDDLAMIDNGETIAQAFGFVHVMGREQDRPATLLEGADDVPELTAAL